MQSISVIIPAFNEEKYLPACLQSILAHRAENVLEVIVIDNASTDRTAEVAASFPGVTVIREPKKGLTAARQCGLQSSTGDLLAFVDADTQVPSDWFTQMNEAFETDKNLVCLSGPYDYFDLSKSQRACVQAYWTVLAMPTYRLMRYMVVGGNFVASRAALLYINGFDTKIAFYGEDTDIGRRLHTQGRVLFQKRFSVQTSGRRLAAQGLLKTGVIYVGNFLSEAFFHRAVTTSYTDIR
jgi:glycosyltransferase involved in cell wall biosynthesis